MKTQGYQQTMSPLLSVLVLLSLIMVGFCMITLQKEVISSFLFLPVAYVFGCCFINYRNPNTNGIGFSIVIILMFIRYVLTVGLLLVSSSINSEALHPNALPLMLYEMTVVFLVLRFFTNRNIVPQFSMIEISAKERPVVKIIFRIVLLGMIVGMVIYPSLRSALFNFSFSDAGSSQNQEIGGLFFVAFKMGLSIVYAYIVTYTICKARRRKIGFWIVVVVSILYISSSWTGSGNVNRWGLLTTMITVYAVLRKTYPERQRIVLVFGGAGAIAVIILSSITKLFVHHGATGAVALLEIFSGDYFNAYFQGPLSVSTGLFAMDAYADRINFVTLLDDTISAYPIINKLFYQQGNLTQLYYQDYIFRNDQILPTIAQGYAHFGAVGAPLFSGLLTYMALVCDRRMKQSSNIMEVVALAQIAIYCALFMAVNVYIIQRATMYFTLIIFVLWLGRHTTIGRRGL